MKKIMLVIDEYRNPNLEEGFVVVIGNSTYDLYMQVHELYLQVLYSHVIHTSNI